MREGRVSETARQVAAARAAHLRFDPAPHLLEDHLAAELLGAEGEELIAAHGDGGAWILRENRLFLPLRARYFEDRVRAAEAESVGQVVILGAGLDTFSFRRPAGSPPLAIFEVDHPSTQAWKRARIAALGWPEPAGLRFAPCDFERASVASALRAAGFDARRPAVVGWMGVVMYLEKQVVEQALRELASLLCRGSEVVLDYLRPWEDLSPRYLELREAIASYLKGASEPQVSRHRAEELLRLVERCGFREGSIERREDVHARYLAPLRTSIPLSERFGLALARR